MEVVEVDGHEIGPGAELSGIFLGGADLSGVDLAGANLVGTALAGANLTGANLSGANLTGATAHGVYLDGTDLSGAILDETALSGMSDSAETVWPDGFDSGAFRRLTRHGLHYEFCHKALPRWVFGPTKRAMWFIGQLRMARLDVLSEYWNALSGEFQNLWTTPQDFDLTTLSIADTEWVATVITPPPALEAVEAHYIGVLNNVERLGYFRYVCRERDGLEPEKAHIGEWFGSGERENLGSVTLPSVDTMFEVLEILTRDS